MIEAATQAIVPEFDFQDDPIDEIVRSYLARGCALLRGFVDPAALLNLRLLLEPFFTKEPGAHVYSSDIIKAGLLDFHQYLFAEKHRELLSAIFGGDEYAPHQDTNSRRIVPSGIDDPRWQPPLAPHMDAFFHSFDFTVNFWVPFNACGDDKPSLGVVPVSFQTAGDFAGYDGNPAVASGEQHPHFGNFRPEMRALWYGDPDVRANFHSTFRNRVWTPTYQLGDAMMLSNWTLHFTHARADMNTRRENVELRFHSNASLETILHMHAE
jgi:hypothetical protein